MTDLTGKRVGQYQLLRKLGEGGMGQVYLAFQPSMGREVAIKLIADHGLAAADFGQRFEREVKAYALLSHANIIKVFDYARSPNQAAAYLVMEYLKGGTLSEYIRSKHPLPFDTIARLLDQVASALDYAHAKGVVHRDLKSLNVLLDESGNAFVSDFGMAKLQQAPTMTQPGTAMGTAYYMSPEQWKGKPPLNHQVDIYALGVMLWEMLTSRMPYDAENPASLMYKHLEEPVPVISNLRVDVPSGVQGVLEKAMAKVREQRFQTAGEVAISFREAFDEKLPNPGVQKQTSRLPRPFAESFTPARARISLSNISKLHLAYTLSCTGIDGEINRLMFSPDGGTLLAACGDYIVSWDLKTRQEITRINVFPEYAGRSDQFNPMCAINWLAISADRGSIAAIALVIHQRPSQSADIQQSVKLWGGSTWHPLVSEPIVSKSFTTSKLSLSNDGTLLAVSDDTAIVRLWETKNGRKLREFIDPPFRTGSLTETQSNPIITSDNSTLIVGNDNGSINIWDIRSNAKTGYWSTNRTAAIRFVSLLPSGNRLLTVDDNCVTWLWDYPSGSMRQIYESNEGMPVGGYLSFESAFFSPTGNCAAVAGHMLDTTQLANSVYFINTWWLQPARKLLYVPCPKEPEWLYLTSDGGLLFLHGEGTLVLVDVQNQQPLHMLYDQDLRSPGISPDETQLAVVPGASANTIQIYTV